MYKDDTNLIPPLCKKIHKKHDILCVKEYLRNHPIIQFMSGIPLVISIMAPLAVEKSLGEIFKYMAQRNSGNF